MEQNNENTKVKASPAARRIARELGLDLAQISGTGIDGRIQLEDVHAYQESVADAASPQIQEEPVAQSDESVTAQDQEEEVYEFVQAEEIPSEETISESDAEEEPIPEVIEEFSTEESEAEAPALSADEEVSELTETKEASEEFANPAEPVFESEEETPDTEQECTCETCEEEDGDANEEDYSELDDFDLIPPMPVSISLQVSDEGLISMLEGMQAELDDELINAVVKSVCCALKKAEISVYEDKVNVLELEGKDIYARTAINAHESKISEIEYTDEEFEDVLINIWDLTDTGLRSFQKCDVDTMHLFILYDDSTITVEMTCDEYLLDVGECAYFMQILKKYLQHPSYMLL
ncbi:MAG: E3 binding domain-containing protein [Anaerofustis sp.]